MPDDELHDLTITKAIHLIRQKQISASDLRAKVLARIDRLNPEVHAFITVLYDESASDTMPPLFGVPISVKDLYDTRGIKTTAGARLHANRIPDEDADAVGKLRGAGAAIIGKTNLHEFAYGVTTVNPHYGTALNPWNRAHISGGSSGGSAVAVALSMGLGSLGTDTGGSIRIPASLCGIVGLKPTFGLVSTSGIVPLSWSLDHAGPMTKTVEDAALLLQVIADRSISIPKFADSLTGDVQNMRVGIPKSYFYENLHPDVATALERALGAMERLGARIVDVDLPMLPVHLEAWVQIAAPEAFSYHESNLKEHGNLYGTDVRTRLETGRTLLSVDYVRAQQVRTAIQMGCAKTFEKCDVIITPTTPIPAPRIDALNPTVIGALGRFTRYFNLAGVPAISVPCGFTSDGLPIGMQIAGARLDEVTVLRAAHAYERTARWFEHQPLVS
jgi:aspartyl-tRNA(Asn)/glutamyl-tRNA(Gln) amidotransferase subunit A